MVYLDSSLVLSIYLDEARRGQAEEIWHGDDALAGSALTVAETVVALRRSLPTPRSREKTRWLAATLSRVEADFEAVSIVHDLKGPLVLLWKEERLSSCRASDALHVATAVWLHRETGRPVFFASLDGRQRQVAAACGLSLLPDPL